MENASCTQIWDPMTWMENACHWISHSGLTVQVNSYTNLYSKLGTSTSIHENQFVSPNFPQKKERNCFHWFNFIFVLTNSGYLFCFRPCLLQVKRQACMECNQATATTWFYPLELEMLRNQKSQCSVEVHFFGSCHLTVSFHVQLRYYWIQLLIWQIYT